MNLLNQSIKTHGYSNWYNYQFSLVVGAAASLPAGLMSGAQVITNLFQAAINFSNDKQQASQCFWAARDLFIIFSNNLLNICTLGLLNSVLLKAGLLELKAPVKQVKKGNKNPQQPSSSNPSGKAPPLPSVPPPPLPANPSPGAASAFLNPSRGVPFLPSALPQFPHSQLGAPPRSNVPSPAPSINPSPGAFPAFPNPQLLPSLPNVPPPPLPANPSPGTAPAFRNPPGYLSPLPNAPAQLLPSGWSPGAALAPQNPPIALPPLPNTPPPAMPANKPSEKVSWTDADSKQVQGSLRLAPGKHNIMLQHDGLQGYQKGAIVELITNHPIYGFSNARYGQMPERGPCLVMNRADFNTIQQVIHRGAFGGDYSDIGNGYVVVWKIPADLLYIADYQPDSTPVDVGTYQLYDDMQNFVDPFQLVNQADATKMRIDAKVGPYEADSVHYFTIQGQRRYFLAGISTGSFYKDFYNPTQQEEGLVRNMLAELKQYGVGAFLCNGAHHAVIFYTYTQNQPNPILMLPREFALLLQNDSRIFQAIQKAANKNLQTWGKTFIATFKSLQLG